MESLPTLSRGRQMVHPHDARLIMADYWRASYDASSKQQQHTKTARQAV